MVQSNFRSKCVFVLFLLNTRAVWTETSSSAIKNSTWRKKIIIISNRYKQFYIYSILLIFCVHLYVKDSQPLSLAFLISLICENLFNERQWLTYSCPHIICIYISCPTSVVKALLRAFTTHLLCLLLYLLSTFLCSFILHALFIIKSFFPI